MCCSHYDVFDPESYGPQSSQRVNHHSHRPPMSRRLLMHTCGVTSGLSLQRTPQIATVLFYLTDVAEGGETIFPLESEGGLSRLAHIDYHKCNDGLKVRHY